MGRHRTSSRARHSPFQNPWKITYYSLCASSRVYKWSCSMTKVSAPYLYRKCGVYYLQKRIPKPLIPKYRRSILQRSLRTTKRADAVRLSSSIVSSLEREWQALLFDLPEHIVYKMVKSVFSHFDEFRSLHPALAPLTKDQMIRTGLTAPLHPGALKYYREIGLMK